jgi:hypothetical protein
LFAKIPNHAVILAGMSRIRDSTFYLKIILHL